MSPSARAILGTLLVPSGCFVDTSVVSVPCRTLIVDDDADMAFLAGEMIRLANDGLLLAGIAYSGDEAMEKLAEADVVVLDFRMPGRNGLELASDILAVRPGQKIVLFSAYLDNATLDEAERLGICECVSKDAVSDLPDVVRRHCTTAA